MCKRLAFMLAVFLAITACFGAAAEESEVPGTILFVCNAAAGSPEETAVRSVTKFLTYMGKDFDLATPDAPFLLNDYEAVYLLIGAGDRLSDRNAAALRGTEKSVLVIGPGGITQLTDKATERSGYFEISYVLEGDQPQTCLTDEQRLYFLSDPDASYGGTVRPVAGGDSYPLCAAEGHLAQIAWYAADPAWMPFAAADMITRWTWPYQNAPHQYGVYMVLDSVYPFEDPELLLQVSELMEKQSVPYAIMVMPVYSNATYPAMKRFCETLRYLQSRGAAIVLRTPLVTIGRVETEELKQHIQLAYEAYTQYGVYPLALAAPEQYLYGEDGLEVIGGARTVLLFETDDAIPLESGNLAYPYGHVVIAPAYTALAGRMPNNYPTAVYLNLHDGLEALTEQVQAYRNSSAPLASLWNLRNTLYIGPHYFFSNGVNSIVYD
ncbi:MAG TPA: DUF2334 domain-containing protein, partial [Candidatus Limiplasma sp.]|nr:DUF2334 domain-containing protein [Candidatus Limiplasma sp.]